MAEPETDLICNQCEPWYPRICDYCKEIKHCHTQEDEWERVKINKFCGCVDEYGIQRIGCWTD